MSAIGSYVVLRRGAWQGCLALAQNVRIQTTGRWIFKQSRVAGTEEFRRAWQAAVVLEAEFDHSGYVLGNYLDAQQAVNGVALVDEQSQPAKALSKVFTAGFFFDAPVVVPDLPAEELLAFCREEYGGDAPGMVEAITAAHRFYLRGLAEISPEHVVVFVIR
jgi:hypothetical protein